jgi:SH3-like domain-containing protein
MTRVVIVKPHTPTYADPISFLQGEWVEVQKPDSEYPNWHWCRNHAGKVGWVHASFLAATAVAKGGYRNRA